MGVQIDKDWHFKKARSEQASKSTFAFKVNKKLKEQKCPPGFISSKKYSQEVIVKITGGLKVNKDALKLLNISVNNGNKT